MNKMKTLIRLIPKGISLPINLLRVIYYYLLSSYKIWRVKRDLKDDIIYVTQKNVEIRVYRGKKSQYDFIVKFKEPGKRERTPAHVHLIVEMYVKYAYDPALTLQLKNHILGMFNAIGPATSFPPSLQFFQPGHVNQFQNLDAVGEFTVEFLLVVIELIAIQEKTNYPTGFLIQSLYQDFGVKDRFSVIQKAILKR